jgi:uncharacterized membrane protein YebE (DUF533 family)
MVVLGAGALIGYWINDMMGVFAGLAIGIIPAAALGFVAYAAVRKQQADVKNARYKGPSGTHPPAHSRVVGSDEKLCPFCDETIKIGARKCRFCAELLE